MYLYSNLQNVNNHPVMSYFKTEYKEDWEFAYNQFMEQKKSERPSLLSRIKNFFYSIFPTEQEVFERKLSNCKSLMEVEEMIRENDRKQIQYNFLGNRGKTMGLVA